MRRRMGAAFLLLLLASCASGSERTPDPSQTSFSPSPTETQVEVPPVDPVLLRFAVIGDFGSGFEGQSRVADRMCGWRERKPFGLVLTTGDNIYEAGEPEHFDDKFFEPYECLLNDGVRFRAVLGNHDIVTDNGRPELEESAFGMKGRNYVVRKNGVRFVMWESNYPNREWLRKHLTEEPGDKWTVVAFHHPVFSPGAHGSTPGFAPSLPRLFRRKGVDLVLNGHDHLYAAMPEKRRIRYVVTGGGGASLRACEDPEITEVCMSRHHFLYVVARAETMTVKAVPDAGKPFHTFTTEGRRRVPRNPGSQHESP